MIRWHELRSGRAFGDVLLLVFGIALALGLLASAPAAADITLDIDFAGPAEYTPGTTAVYTLHVANTGDMVENALHAATAFPDGATVTGAVCEAVGTGSICSDAIGQGDLDASGNAIAANGGSITWTLTVAFASDLALDPLSVAAPVASSDATQSDTVEVSSSLKRISELAVTKSASLIDGLASYTPGTSAAGQFTLEVTNQGPSDAPGVTLTDLAPTGMTIASWTCQALTPGGACPNSGGSGDINEVLDIAAGAGLAFTLDADFASDMRADPLVNDAMLDVPPALNDPGCVEEADNPGVLVCPEHAASASLARDARVDLDVQIQAAGQSFIPGTGGFQVELLIGNAGPSDAFGASLPLAWPGAVELAEWGCLPVESCSPASGSGDGDISLDIAADGSATVNVVLAFDSAARADLVLSALVESTDGVDEDTGNNADQIELTVDRRADVEVVKRADFATIVNGASFGYGIEVRNLGPSDIGPDPASTEPTLELGVLLEDVFPEVLLGSLDQCADPDVPCWRACSSDGGIVGQYTPGTCPDPNDVVEGSGDIADLNFNLAAGSTSTVEAFVRVDSTANAQTVTNTAMVLLDESTPTSARPFSVGGGADTGSVDTELVFGTDLRVATTDGTVSAVAGQAHVYTIVVENTGFANANGVAVADSFPLFAAPAGPGFTSGSVSWQCRAFNGACCNSNTSACGLTDPTAPVFTDALAGSVDLPAQSRVEFTVTGTLDPRATGTLVNQAAITVPSGIEDPITENNVSVDDDTELLVQPGLRISKQLRSITDTNGNAPFTLNYRIVIDNDGPSFAAAAVLADPLDDFVLVPATAAWSCSVRANPGNTVCGAASGSGGPLSTTLAIDPGGRIRIDLSVQTNDSAIGQVTNTATLSAAGVQVSDSVTTSLRGSAKLSVTKTAVSANATPGNPMDYVIEVRNEGPDDVFGATVKDTFPPEFDSVAWSCTATTPVPGDLALLGATEPPETAGNAVVVSPDGRHVYVIGQASDSLMVFQRNITPGAGFGEAQLLEIERDGANDSSDPGLAVFGMQRPIDVAISPDGGQVFVLAQPVAPPDATEPVDTSPSLVVFSRDLTEGGAAFGRLSFADRVGDGLPSSARRLAVTQTHVYVTGSGDPVGEPDNTADLISIFQRSSTTGVPAHDVNLTVEVPQEAGPIVVDAARSLAFVASAANGSVSMYSVDPAQAALPAGRLSLLGTAASSPAAPAVDLALAPDAPQLYLSVAGATALRRFGYDGLAPSLAFRRGDELQAGIADPGTGGNARIAIAPDGEHLVGSVSATGVVFAFRRDPVSGNLSFQESTASTAGLDQAAEIAVSPDGRHLLVATAASGDGGNSPLTIISRTAPDPLFEFIEVDRDSDDPGLRLRGPVDQAISPDGRHVYALSLGENAITMFERTALAGLDGADPGAHLVPVASWVDGDNGVAGLDRARRVLVSPDGTSLFVTSDDNSTLAVFRRDNDPASAGFGRLTFLQNMRQGQDGVAGINGARGMVMDPTSTHLYVAGSFGSSIALFSRAADGTLSFVEQVVGGSNGVTGLAGISELAITGDGDQVMGTSVNARALAVFNRNRSGQGVPGRIDFVQAQPITLGDVGVVPTALAIPGGNADAAGEHVYVASQNADALLVLRRVTDPTSASFGRVLPLAGVVNGQDGLAAMNGPVDVAVSEDGKRIYVAAEFSDSLLVFDRDTNAASEKFGMPNLVEFRTDGIGGVDGLRSVRSISLSRDSRFVYASGFGDDAIASFRLGVGSVCASGGGGNIDDRVDIGVGGTIEYRATGILGAAATGSVSNTVEVSVPSTFIALAPQSGCPNGADYCATATKPLVPAGSLSISKEAEQVSFIAGETARYTITIENAGPSSLVHEPGFPLTVSDPLDGNPSFVQGSAVWRCEASGSGQLDFMRAWRETDPLDGQAEPLTGLAGVSGLALVPGTSGARLVGASVLDDSVSVFARDPASGALVAQFTARSGEMLGGQLLTALDGAQAVAVSADGEFLYVASRISDSVTVFSLTAAGGLALVQTVQGLVGLDQAIDLALSTDGAQRTLYVAGANDDAVAVFQRDAQTGRLTWIQSVQQGIGGVSGLADVSKVVVSPDGRQVYALSPTTGAIALFERNTTSSALTWRTTYDQLDLGVGLGGIDSAVFDADGQFLYVASEFENAIHVLARDTGTTSTRGSLSPASSIRQSDAGVTGLVGVSSLAITADGVNLYASSQSGDTVAWFVRDSIDGRLRFAGLRTNLAAGVEGLDGAGNMVVDDALGQLFVAGTRDAAIVQFERSADSFCPASGAGELVDVPFNIGAGGSVVFTIDVEVAGDATGVIENTAELTAARDPDNPSQSDTETSVSSTVADLAITKDDGLSEIDGLHGARAVAATGAFVYVAAPDDNAIGVFSRNFDQGTPGHGALEFVEAVRNGENGVDGLGRVSDIALTGDRAHVYTTSPLANSLTVFERNAAGGGLDFLEVQQNGVLGVSGISGASALALSGDDAHVYVTGRFSNAVSTFARQVDPLSPDFGMLEFVDADQNGLDGVAGMIEPVALAVAPDGRHVYVLGADGDTLVVFARNSTPGSGSFGRLTYLMHYANNSDGVGWIGGVRDLVVSADGERLYVLGDAAGTLARFDRDPASGGLAFVDFLADGTGGVTGLTGARSLLLDDATGTLYAAGAAAGAIARFAIDPDSGAPTFVDTLANGDPAPLTGGEAFGLEGVSGLVLPADGDHLYAVSDQRDAVLTLQRTGGSSELEFQQILIDGLGGIAPGVEVEYLITVENLGPSDVDEARVVDRFPDAFEQIAWQCSAAQGSGAQCISGGSGDLDTVASLPAGGRITIRASGVVSAGATGRLVNTATVSAIGVTDPVPGNNSATDDDTVLSPAADLIVTVDNGVDSVVPGDSVGWDVIVSNNGPSSVRGVLVEDRVPAALFGATWSCSAEPAAGTLGDPLAQGGAFAPAALEISADGRFAVAVGGDRVEVFRRDILSGALESLQVLAEGVDGVTGIRGGRDVAITADGRFFFVAAADSDALALFARDSGTGAFGFVAFYQDGQVGVEGLGGVSRILLGPGGAHLYAAGALDQALAVFAVDEGTGHLSQTGLFNQGVDDVDGLNRVTGLTLTADGTALLVTAAENQSLAVFRRDSLSGALGFVEARLNADLLGTASEDALLAPAAVVEAGDRILVAARGSDRLGQFALQLPEIGVTPVPRALTALGVIDGATVGSALTAPSGLAYDPDQARLYVAAAEGIALLSLLGEVPQLVEQFPAATTPVLAGLETLDLGPGGRHLYSLGTAAGTEIGVWTRERGSRCGPSGQVSLGRQPVDIVSGGQLVYRVEGRVQANATGELRYTASVTNPVDGQELNPTDNSATDVDPLSPRPDLGLSKIIETAPVVAGLPVAWRIDLDNAGLSDAPAASLVDPMPVFPASSGGITAGSLGWSCQANPPLDGAEQYAIPAPVSSLVIGPQRNYLYATVPAVDALQVYPILADDTLGAPSTISEGDALPGGEATGLGGASAVAVSADGLSVYVAGESGNSLVAFRRAEAGAPLDYAQTFTTTSPVAGDAVAGLRGARMVRISADQRFVFVAGATSNAIAVFARDRLTGQLEFVERVGDALDTIAPEFDVIKGVADLHVTAASDAAYAVAPGSQAISRFSVNAQSGVLTFEAVLRAGDSGLPDLAGIRAITASPGDTHLYALADAGVLVFGRGAGGGLEFQGLFDAFPGPAPARGLIVDSSGSRAYLLAGGIDGSFVHVLRRDWTDGSLEFWYSQALEGGSPKAMAQDAIAQHLYVADGENRLDRFDERALSRCRPSTGGQDMLDTRVDLGATGWSTFELDATVHPSARGTLDNSATAVPSEGEDPDRGNNTALASAPIEVISDISVTKTGPAEAVAGEPIVYEITVTNTGPSSALGVVITDIAPSALEQIEWTCAASDGSTCLTGGTGAPVFSADVLPDGQLDIILNAVIDPAFIGLMTNAVALTPEPDSTDPTPGDHADSVETEVVAVADISVTKASVNAEIVAGLPVVWRIDVVNDGPSDAPSVDIADTLPQNLSNVTWTCTAAGGATCPAGGTDAPDFNAFMPADGSLEILIDADLAAAATGNLVNTVDAVVAAPVNEPDLSNNIATASDVIEVRADMAIELTAPRNPFDPAGSIELPLNVAVVNLGPSNSRNVDVIIDFSAPVQQTNAGCTQPLATRVRCLVSQLDPGATRTLELSLTALPQAPSTLVVDGLVLTSAEDINALNDTDSVSIELVTGIDLDVSVDNGFDWLSPGQAFDYLIRIDNFGSVDAGAVDVTVPVPMELLDAEWTCEPAGAASCDAAALGGIVDSADVPSGDSVTYRLSVLVDPLVDLTVPQSVTLTASADASPPGDDINLVNNIGVDQDEIRLQMFQDGFESDTAIPSRVQPVEADMSCLSIDVARDSSAADTPLRVLDAHSATGERLLWLDLSRRGAQSWFQVSVMQADGLASSGWMAWPEGEDGMSIRIDDRRAELLSGRTSLWAAPGRLPDSLRSVSRAPLRHVDVGTGLFEVNGCDSQINSDTGVQ